MKNDRPKILMFGNGINRAYGGLSWNALLNKIATREDLKPYLKEDNDKKLHSPMPLQAILLTDNKIDEAIEKYRNDFTLLLQITVMNLKSLRKTMKR